MAFYSRKDLISGKACPEKPEPNKKSELSPTALVFSLGIAGAAFLIISYLALRRCASQRRSSPPPRTYSNREEFADGLEGPEIDHPVWYIRTIGLPQGVIESIPRFTYKKGEGLIETTSDCSVCLSEFEDGESLRLLPKCSHAFHVACIDTWLGSHTNCPLCRSPVQPGLVEPSLTSDGGGNVGIEIPEVGNGAMTLTLTGQAMEGVRRSVSLDLSSALDIINVEANKALGAKRSISISGPSVLV